MCFDLHKVRNCGEQKQRVNDEWEICWTLESLHDEFMNSTFQISDCQPCHHDPNWRRASENCERQCLIVRATLSCLANQDRFDRSFWAIRLLSEHDHIMQYRSDSNTDSSICLHATWYSALTDCDLHLRTSSCTTNTSNSCIWSLSLCLYRFYMLTLITINLLQVII